MDAVQITKDCLYLASKCKYSLKLDWKEVDRLERAGVNVGALLRTGNFHLAGFRPRIVK